MKILLVIDQYDSANNGTTISARRFAEELKRQGHQVKVVACGTDSDYKYGVDRIHFLPIAEHIIKSQGMQIALPNKRALTEGLMWADVVHFMIPFFLSIQGLKIAEEMGVPHTAAFHVQPENITFSIGLGNSEYWNNFIYCLFRDKFYNRIKHIHCPSNFIANQLKEHGYTAQLHVISNGISPKFKYNKTEKPDSYKDKFVIAMIGRLSGEKRQDVLINAIDKSKYRNKIQLILAGQGPKLESIRKLGSKLPNPPVISFFDEDKLREVLSFTDLYVHAADVEIEAISCIEAFASGLVPIIANAYRSATPQFALDERSLFEAGNEDSLAQKIDYWIEHEDERKKREFDYAEKGREYHLEQCVMKAADMFRQAISESENDWCEQNTGNKGTGPISASDSI